MSIASQRHSVSTPYLSFCAHQSTQIAEHLKRSLLLVGAAIAMLLPGGLAQAQDDEPSVLKRSIAPTRVAFGLESAELQVAARNSKPGDRLVLRGVPLFDGPTATLELESFDVFRPDARIEVETDAGTVDLDPPDTRLFRGHVEGKPSSIAFVAVSAEGAVQGLISDDDRIFLIGSEEPDSATAMLGAAVRVGQLEDEEFAAQEVPFKCGNEDHAASLDVSRIRPDLVPEPLRGLVTKAQAATSTYAVDVALETDHEFYQIFGSNNGALNYISVLFGAIAAIYERDVSTQLRVSYTKLYATSNDPWGTNTNNYLSDLVNYWRQNRTGVARTIVHQLRGRSDGFGVAYVGVLCSQNYGYGLTASIRGNYSPSQTVPVWDLVAVAHELGHNFSSPHTHCYSPEIDECSNAGNGCYSGPLSVPSDGGTIMSYCHLRSGGMNNINTWLGRAGRYGDQSERVNQRMLGHLGGAQNSGCLPSVQAASIIFGDAFESGSLGDWTASF